MRIDGGEIGDRRARRAHWERLARAATIALACGAFGTCAPSYEGRYPHVLLISLDTTRADHVGCYGSARVTTPNVDRLAREGTLFRSVTAAAPTTLADHTSIMTGLYPHTHGVSRNGFDIAPENVMLAQILARHGFRTAAFLGSFTLASRFGFDRGFDEFDEQFDILADAREHDQDQRRAAAVTDAALHWVDRAPSGAAFVFVHYFDAHAPYEPPPPFDTAYARAGAPKCGGLADLDRATRFHQRAATGVDLGQDQVINHGLTRELATKDPGPPADIDRDLEALYSGEIAYVDRELGRLIDGLTARGWLESSLVVVCADHGETFAEHGDSWNHGLWVYDTTVRVPLIVRRSDHREAHEVAVPVSTVDIAPTILALAGIGVPREMEGRDLSPSLGGEAFARGPVFAEATQPAAVEKGATWRNERKPKCVRDGRWKLIRAPYLELEQLFDLESDPGERENLLALPAADSRAALAQAKALELGGELEKWAAAAHPCPSQFDSREREDTLRRLRNLGYPGGDEGEPPDKH